MSASRRSLLITPFLPWPGAAHGGAQRTALLRRSLAELGPVDLMVMAPAEHAPADGEPPPDAGYGVAARFAAPAAEPCGPWRHLRRLGGPAGRLGELLATVEGRYLPVPEAAEWLGRQLAAGRYDLIVCRYLRPAMLAGVDRAAGVPCVLDLDDLDWHLLASQLEASPWPGWRGRLAARLAMGRTRAAVIGRLGRFDRLCVCTPAHLGELGRHRASVLPNVPYHEPDAPIAPRPPRPESRQIVCVSTLSYKPNRDGIDHFLDRCWPRVRAAVPDATLRVVGRGPAEDARRWSAVPGVEVAGFVDDLGDAYGPAAFALAPVRWGAGTKIKVVEALAYGRTCLVTPHALHGYEGHLRHGEALWCGPTDAAMADGCIALLTDPSLRDRLADRGRSVVAAEYSDDRFREVVRATCEPLIGGAAPNPNPSPAEAAR